MPPQKAKAALQSNPLAGIVDDEDREEAQVVAAAQAAGEIIRDLPTRSVAPDPENPLSRLAPDKELTASIKAEGQLQAGVVVPLAMWISYGNDPALLYTARAEADGAPADGDPDAHAAAIAQAKAEIEYVIVFGHRRWAATNAAGNKLYRAVVSDTIKDNTTKRVHRLIENFMRAAAQPLEEAAEFHLLMSDGLSQREISRRTGIPQPHISKRISLRKLPNAAQQSLADDTISIEVANELAKLGDSPQRINDVITRVRNIVIDGKTDDERQRQIEERNRVALDHVRRERASHEAHTQREKLRAQLRADGVTVVDDLAAHFGEKNHERWRYQLHGDDAITTARHAGTAIAYVYSRDQVEWYTTEEPAEPQDAQPESAQPGDEPTGAPAAPETGTGSIPAPRAAAQPVVRETPEQRQQREERERQQRDKRAADEARAAACERIASKAPNRDQLTARLARRLLLCEDTYDHTAQQLTAQWLKAAGMVSAETPTHVLFGKSHGLDSKGVARIAYVYDLALDEARIRDSDTLDPEDRAHIERLTNEAGYKPGTWEQQRLDEPATAAS